MNAKRIPPPRGFPVAEYAARLERAQRLMAQTGVDLLLVTTPENISYFSGFPTPFFQSPTRPWFLLLPKQGRPVAVIPEIGATAMARTWVEDIRTWASPQPRDDGISLLEQAIRDLTGASGILALPMGAETTLRMPLADYERLRTALAGREIADATPVIRTLRMVKSEREIEKIRYTCQCVSDAFDDAPALFSIGQSDIEAFRRFRLACLQHGVDDVAYLVGGAGPDGYEDIISPPSGRLLCEGDVLMMDTGCTFDGYYCDFDRNFAFGSVSDRVLQAYDAVYRATSAGLAAARPGRSCADLFRAMQSVLDDAGASANDTGRLGHGLGLQLTEWPSNAPFDDTVLRPGMVITLEPGMSFAPNRMMVHEENIVIREGEPELLTRRAARELPIIR
jgi:Xaa-Pro aminopeptidase